MRRVVLLGGSNVARGISNIVETARRIVGGPAEFLIAMGHGRSYGQRSTILGRGLPVSRPDCPSACDLTLMHVHHILYQFIRIYG